MNVENSLPSTGNDRDKVMFEIFRESPGEGRRYDVLYFTELTESQRDRAIDRALDGDPFYGGFLVGPEVDRGKRIIGEILERMNRGEELSPGEAHELLTRSGVLETG